MDWTFNPGDIHLSSDWIRSVLIKANSQMGKEMSQIKSFHFLGFYVKEMIIIPWFFSWPK